MNILFKWKGYTVYGKKKIGFLLLNESDNLRRRMYNSGIIIESYNKLAIIPSLKELRDFKLFFRKKLNLSEKFHFFDTLSILLDSNIELIAALEVSLFKFI